MSGFHDLIYIIQSAPEKINMFSADKLPESNYTHGDKMFEICNNIVVFCMSMALFSGIMI